MRGILKTIVLALLFMSFYFRTYSQENKWTAKNVFNNVSFVKNKGQFAKKERAIKTPILYGVQNSGMYIFLTKKGIVYNCTERKNTQSLEEDKEDEKREAQERKVKTKQHYITVLFKNANTQFDVIEEDQVTDYFTYAGEKLGGNKYETIKSNALKKVTYKNIYNFIDVEFVIHPEGGLKYNVILNPGANLNDFTLLYKGITKLTKASDDKIHIQFSNTLALIEHAPVSYLAEGKSSIAIHTIINGTEEKFEGKDNPLISKKTIIDPWVVNPNIGSNNKAFDVAHDDAGNIYVIGGWSPDLQYKKYSPSGTLLATYLIPFGIWFYGDFAVDGNGNSYIAPGAVEKRIIKLDNAFNVVYINQTYSNEIFRIGFNCDYSVLKVAGYMDNPPSSYAQFADLNPATGALSNYSPNLVGESRAIDVDLQGNIYTLTIPLDASSPTPCAGSPAANFIKKINPSYGVVYTPLSGYSLTECGGSYVGTLWNGNQVGFHGINALKLAGAYVYTFDGKTIYKRWKSTGVLTTINTATIPNATAEYNSGIAIDDCGNVYAGGADGVYKYDSLLNFVQQYPLASAVYDICINSNNEIIACGDGLLASLGSIVCTPFTANITSNIIPCTSNNSITAVPSGGLATYTYLWNDGVTTATHTNVSVGTYSVKVMDSSCPPKVAYDTIVVTTASNVSAQITKHNPTCNAANGDISIKLIGDSITTVSWIPITPAVNTDTTTAISNLSGGAYHCYITTTDGCTYDTIITLQSSGSLTSTVIYRNAQCPASINGTATVNPSGGTPAMSGYVYLWSTNPAQTNKTATGLSSGKYYVTITDSLGCAHKDSVTIGSNPMPVDTFTYVKSCVGDSTKFINLSTLASTPIPNNYTSAWSFGVAGQTSSLKNPSVLYATCGTYSVTLKVTSDSGCITTHQQNVEVVCTPHANFSFVKTCEDKPTSFTNLSTNADNYTWHFGVANDSSVLKDPIHIYSTTGQYAVTLEAKNSAGCEKDTTILVDVYPQPRANFYINPKEATISDGSITFIDSSQLANQIIWYIDKKDSLYKTIKENIKYTFTDSGTYIITQIVKNNDGCTDTLIQKLIIRSEFAIYIPIAFTPNKDGINDFFNVKGVGINEMTLLIFDRWGHQIAEINSATDAGWDGTDAKTGKECKSDLYVWNLSYKDNRGRINQNIIGSVTLMK